MDGSFKVFGLSRSEMLVVEITHEGLEEEEAEGDRSENFMGLGKYLCIFSVNVSWLQCPIERDRNMPHPVTFQATTQGRNR